MDNRFLKHFFCFLTLNAFSLCSAYASERVLEQQFLENQREIVNYPVLQKVNIEELFGGTLSEEELEKVENQQIKEYILQQVTDQRSRDGNLLGILETLSKKGYISKIMDKKEVNFKNKKITLSCVNDFEILKAEEFTQYFVELHGKIAKYNKLLAQEEY